MSQISGRDERRLGGEVDIFANGWTLGYVQLCATHLLSPKLNYSRVVDLFDDLSGMDRRFVVHVTVAGAFPSGRSVHYRFPSAPFGLYDVS